MSVHGALTLVTCAGELALFVLAAARARKSPLGLPLALLSIVLFTSNLASLGFDVSRNPVWNWLDNATAPWTTPLAFHFLVTFVGRSRSLRWMVMTGYAAFGILSALAVSAFFWPWARAFTASGQFSLFHLLGVAPAVAVGIALFMRHLRLSVDPEELQRTRLLLLAFAVLAFFGTTDLWQHLGAPIPRLGNVATLAFSALLAMVALRLRLFDQDLSSSGLVFSGLLGAFGIGCYVAAFGLLEANTALLILATGTLTLALVAAGLPALDVRRARRTRLEQLALTGRFTAQMTHDMKNPLAALKGAAQLLAEEHAQGHSLADKGEFISLLLEQVGRVERVMESYGRLTRVEPALKDVDLNALVEQVLALQHFAAGAQVNVRAQLAAGLPACRADPDLIATVLENLVRNAYEAMPAGGTLTVRSERSGSDAVLLRVEDTGTGMDSRTAERVFDDFFTTKATGTGLGLAFVRRVAQAHSGEVSLDSREGRGTVVTLRLPAPPE
jgi:two-component system sensor histidine kinase HydH